MATLGAQPRNPLFYFIPSTNLLNLVSMPNYSGDALSNGTYSQRLNTPPGMTDTQFISNLIYADQIYNNNLKYSFPDIPTGYMPLGEYNSNSYISGLLKSVGGTWPQLNNGVTFQVPGYSNPIPLPFSAGTIRRPAP